MRQVAAAIHDQRSATSITWSNHVVGGVPLVNWAALGAISTLVAALITAVATGILVWVTWKYMDLTKSLVDEGVRGRQLAQMPVLESELVLETRGDEDSSETRLSLRVGNVGNAPPLNVRVVWVTPGGKVIKDELFGIVGTGISVRLRMVEDEPYTFIDMTYENVYGWQYSQRLTLARDDFWHISDQSHLQIVPPTNSLEAVRLK